MKPFQGKVVLVSGGARGMGAAEARMLVAEGAKVVIGDLREDEGRRLAAELGGASVFVRQDVTEQVDWDRAVAAAEALGGLHGLVNNAGIYKPATLMETGAALFERHLRVNQFGCFLGMKAVVGPMERSGRSATTLRRKTTRASPWGEVRCGSGLPAIAGSRGAPTGGARHRADARSPDRSRRSGRRRASSSAPARSSRQRRTPARCRRARRTR